MLNITRQLVRAGMRITGKNILLRDKQILTLRKRLKLPVECSAFSSSSNKARLNDNNIDKKQKQEMENPLQDGDFNDKTAAEYLSKLSEEDNKRLKTLKLEYEMFLSSGFAVPEEMTDTDWARILFNGTTLSKRKKLYRFLRKKEIHAIKKKNKIELNKKKDDEEENVEKEKYQSTPLYTYFIRLLQTKERQIQHARVAQSMMFGRPFIVDMGFINNMGHKEEKHFIEQLLAGQGFIQKQLEPVDLHLVNFSPESFVYKKMEYIYRMSELKFLFANTSEKCYLDLFPKERLVYLTADAEHDLIEDDVDNIYIIGGIVDLGPNLPLTYAKAKEQNIRCARLPLERHVLWKMGRKELTINQIINIMVTFMDTKDWEKAFSHIPQRKILSENDIAGEDRNMRMIRSDKKRRFYNDFY